MIGIGVKDVQGNTIGKVVFAARRGKNSFSFKSKAVYDDKRLKRLLSSKEVSMAVHTDNITTDSIDIPNIPSDKSKRTLFKSKLRSADKEHPVNYELVYFANEDKTVTPKVNYSVYAVEKDFFQKQLKFNENAFFNTHILTLDVFSVMGISMAYDPSSLVFHMHADEVNLYLILSIGNKLEYSRTVVIPADIHKPDELTNFFYESFNLTFLFVRQNYTRNDMKILLSGKLNNNKLLSELVATFSNISVSKIDYKKIITNISEEDFHDFMIPIGTLFLNEKFDFSSDIIKSDRAIKKVFAFANVLLIPILIVSAFFLLNVFKLFEERSDLMKEMAVRIFNSESDLIRNISSREELKYNAEFVDLIKNRQDSSLSLLKPIEGVLEFQKFSSVTFEGSGSALALKLSADKPQQQFKTIEEYSKEMIKELNFARANGVDIDDKSLHSLKNMRNKLELTVTKGISR